MNHLRPVISIAKSFPILRPGVPPGHLMCCAQTPLIGVAAVSLAAAEKVDSVRGWQRIPRMQVCNKTGLIHRVMIRWQSLGGQEVALLHVLERMQPRMQLLQHCPCQANRRTKSTPTVALWTCRHGHSVRALRHGHHPMLSAESNCRQHSLPEATLTTLYLEDHNEAAPTLASVRQSRQSRVLR